MSSPGPSQEIIWLAHLLAGHHSFTDLSDAQKEARILVAQQQRVAAVLAYQLRQRGETLPQALTDAARDSAVQYLTLRQTQMRVQALLDEAQVEALWFKGIVLAHTHYPDPSLRSMSDIDVLVASENFKRASELLLAAGFQRWEAEFYTEDPATVTLTDGAVLIELHRTLLSGDTAALTADGLAYFWAMRTMVGEKPIVYTWPHELHFLYLCAHIVLQHGEGLMALGHFYDLYLMITKGLNWPQLAAHAVHLRWVGMALHAIGLVEARFGQCVPPAILSALKTQQPVDENDWLVRRYQTSDVRYGQMVAALQQLPPHQKVLLVLRAAFPSAKHMRKRYDIPEKQSVLPYYPKRWASQVRGILIGLRDRLRR
jgi:Uncharacterised nucleotidyltransferase